MKPVLQIAEGGHPAAATLDLAADGLVAKTVQAVHELIRAEGLREGSSLPSETTLALRLGVSRVIVREAFRSLAALGLIAVGAGRRARVAAPDSSVLALALGHSVHIEQTSIQQILDVRRTIEMRTVVLAALRRTDAEAGLIAGLAQAMADDFADPARVMEHDIAFHEAVASVSRNPLFAIVVGAFQVVTRQTWATGWVSRRTDAERRAVVACHADIAAAIGRRSPPDAEAAMAQHFDSTVKALLAAGLT